MRRLDRQIEKQLLKKIDLSRYPFEQVLHLDGDYLVAQLNVEPEGGEPIWLKLVIPW